MHRRIRGAALGLLALVALVALVLSGCGRDDASPPRPLEPAGGSSVRLVEAGRADEPVALTALPGTDTVLVAERAGRVRSYRATDDGLSPTGEVVLDLTDEVEADATEQGLLGLAVAPDGASLVVDFTATGGTAGRTRVVRYDLDGTTVDPTSADELFAADQPFANHNGGSVVVGPDGALYVGVGDGGSQGDPEDRAQDPDGVYGRILRIDPATGERRTWTWGLRNPWQFSFDETTGDLWIGDVGGTEREEVDRLPGDGPTRPGGEGVNLGWSRREGGIAAPDDEGGRGDPSSFVDPVAEYDHADGGCSIVGGPVVRSDRVAALRGRYLYGDYCAGTIWSLDAANHDGRIVVVRGADQLTSFGQDADGRIYALGLGGSIWRLDAE